MSKGSLQRGTDRASRQRYAEGWEAIFGAGRCSKSSRAKPIRKRLGPGKRPLRIKPSRV